MHTSGWGILRVSQPTIAAQVAQRGISSTGHPRECAVSVIPTGNHEKDIVDAFVIRDLFIELVPLEKQSRRECRQEIAFRAGQLPSGSSP